MNQQHLIFPILIGALFIWSVYRRVRRNIGRQPVAVWRIQIRIGLFAVIGGFIVFGVARNLELLGALLAGVAVGAMLGWIGIRSTKFETTAEGNFYTPHLYIGLAVSLLFIGRLAYRFLTIYPTIQEAAKSGQDQSSAMQKSPLTVALFGIVVGYYIFYYIGILRGISVFGGQTNQRADGG